MDPLREWFEYLDRVSRPVRRPGRPEIEPAAMPWRPWMEAPPEAPEGALSPGEIPDLLASGPESPAGCHPASRKAEDPTLHDELQPIPEFAVPSLKAPGFEIVAPRLNAAAGPELENGAATQPAGDARLPEEPAEAGAKGGASSSPASGGRAGAGDHPASRRPDTRSLAASRRLLSGGSRGPAGSGDDAAAYSAQALKSREQLVQRLVDPTLTLEETALLLGVCTTTVRRYTNRGVLRHFRTEGNQRRFRLSDVLEFIERREGEPPNDRDSERDG